MEVNVIFPSYFCILYKILMSQSPRFIKIFNRPDLMFMVVWLTITTIELAIFPHLASVHPCSSFADSFRSIFNVCFGDRQQRPYSTPLPSSASTCLCCCYISIFSLSHLLLYLRSNEQQQQKPQHLFLLIVRSHLS